jgi:hypothetical protein
MLKFQRNMLSPPSALKMETVCFSETMASTNQPTWRQNPEEHHRQHIQLSGLHSNLIPSKCEVGVLIIKPQCLVNVYCVKSKQVKLSCYMGREEVCLLLILNLGTRWEWVVSVMPQLRFTPGEWTPSTHWIGGWVGLRTGLDAGARRKILCLCQGSNPDRPARSQTLYCLSYYGS